MKNNRLIDIFNILDKSDSILFLTHVIIDGDSAGSAKALARVMADRGKSSHIFTGETFPDSIGFLKDDLFIDEEADLLKHYDVVVAVDCSDSTRFRNRAELFKRGTITVNIDHHRTNDFYGQYNYVDPDASATGEIIFELLKEGGVSLTPEISEGLYAAIVTDTGRFQYSNTTAKTHRIVAELLDSGLDQDRISVQIYQNVRKEKYVLEGIIMKTMELYCEGRFAFAYCSQEMFKEADAEIQDSDGIVELLRDINTVEVACFAKETKAGVYKAGFRSKYDTDVSIIAQQFNGGGHKKASGCSIPGTIDEVRAAVLKAVSEKL